MLRIELEAASKPKYSAQAVGVSDRYIEHPLDFEWLFTKQGAARICDEIKNAHRKEEGDVLCLGCPSVYVFGKRNLKTFNFRLWDKNVLHLGQIEEAREVSCVDFTDKVHSCEPADVVVIDPPWYNPYYLLFLWAASHCLVKGGRVVLSFPPEGTRASVRDELNELMAWCKNNSYKIEKRIPNLLPYRSPLFEVNALRAQGVTNFPLNWRRGDLIILKKVSDTIPAKPEMPIPKEKWEEVRIGHVRIKVCRSKARGRCILTAVGPKDILASVSSRQRSRKLANVVTSGNRFLQTKSPDELISCLSVLKSGGYKNMSDSFIVSKHPLLMRKALDLILREETEVANYFRLINEI